LIYFISFHSILLRKVTYHVLNELGHNRLPCSVAPRRHICRSTKLFWVWFYSDHYEL